MSGARVRAYMKSLTVVASTAILSAYISLGPLGPVSSLLVLLYKQDREEEHREEPLSASSA